MKKMSTKLKVIIITLVSLFVVGLAILIAWLANGTSGIVAMFNFVSSQILGMKWLNDLIGLTFTAMFGAEFMASVWGGAIQFFIYDIIKIISLLCVLIFIISYIQSYFPPERTKLILEKRKGIVANIFGALLGTVTPFCSCSSIPIFVGFTRGV